MDPIDPGDLGKAFSEIPLFREIQRLLAAGTGPVNWEIARQIATAVAGAGEHVRIPDQHERAGLEEACRIAELRITEQTRLEPPPALTKLAVQDRSQWVDMELKGLGPFIDRLSIRLRGQLQADAAPAVQMQAFFFALGPFLLGVQMGFLVGSLSRRALGQYDICLPRHEPGRLSFIYPNILDVEQELEVDPRQFRMWLALHEVAHQIEFKSIPWTGPHLVGLVERYIDAAEIDVGQIEARIQEATDPEQLTRLMEHPEQVLPMLMTPSRQALADQIRSFVGVLEGFVEWAVEGVGAAILPEFEKIREGINRRRVERSPIEKLLEQLLGFDLQPEHYREAQRFVGAVAGADQLAALWRGPEGLPTREEVSDPTGWLSRVAFS